jgi:hypothetical protein
MNEFHGSLKLDACLRITCGFVSMDLMELFMLCLHEIEQFVHGEQQSVQVAHGLGIPHSTDFGEAQHRVYQSWQVKP